jgi:Periplasmic protease
MKVRIIAVFLTLLLLFPTAVYASGETNTGTDTGASAGTAEPASESSAGKENYNFDSYYYSMFDNFATMYMENHLYDFTKEELLEGTLKNLIDTYPSMYEAILNSMLTSMDRYSSFHPAGSNYLSIDSLGYGMNLVDITKETAQAEKIPVGTYITDVVSGSNAAAAGLLAGDRIVSVLGLNVDGLAFSGINKLLRISTTILAMRDEKAGKTTAGDAITPCDITVSRKNENGEYEMITVSLSKGVIPGQELSYSFDEKDGVAYVDINSFLGETLSDDFTALIKAISSKGIKKLTIDLRDNGGGIYQSAVSMANALIPEKDSLLYYYRNKSMKEPEAHYSDGTGSAFDSIAVLVNGNTASAAELMAVILQSKGKAVLVGEKTYGKALGQSQFHSADGDILSITSYEILTDKKESYDGIGLQPNIVCPLVEVPYVLPKLEYFNHTNYVDIVPGAQNEPTLALEKRLVILGCLREEDCDGKFDENTGKALALYQILKNIEVTGTVTFETVSYITRSIDAYKDFYYYVDSQCDVAMMYHTNFSQAKRLATEKINEKAKNDELKAAKQKAKQDTVEQAPVEIQQPQNQK